MNFYIYNFTSDIFTSDWAAAAEAAAAAATATALGTGVPLGGIGGGGAKSPLSYGCLTVSLLIKVPDLDSVVSGACVEVFTVPCGLFVVFGGENAEKTNKKPLLIFSESEKEKIT